MDIGIGTYIFYTFLLVFMTVTSKQLAIVDVRRNPLAQYKWNYWFPWGVVIVLFYSVAIGSRDNVGRDYSAYLSWYNEVVFTGRFSETREVGYLMLNKILVWLNADYVFLFIIIAFLHIFFLLKSLNKYRFLLPWYMFFFFTSLLMFSSMNIMRQTIAYFIFFYAITLALEKKYLWVILFLAIGVTFHKSIALFIWIFPFLKFDWFKNRYLQIALLVLVTFLSGVLFSGALSYISPVAKLLGYDYYSENVDLLHDITEDTSVGAGLGKYLFLFIDVVIILYSLKLKSRFKKYDFTAFYNLYFVGAILERVLADNFVFARTNDYLANFRVLILSFLCFYLFKYKSKNPINVVVLVVILTSLMAYFYRGIANSAADCAPFKSLIAF